MIRLITRARARAKEANLTAIAHVIACGYCGRAEIIKLDELAFTAAA